MALKYTPEPLKAYAALGLEPGASEADLKSAHRKLAMQHQPDRNPNNPEAANLFHKAQSTYDLLNT